MKGHIIWEFLLPAIIGGFMLYMSYNLDGDSMYLILARDFYMPFLFCVMIPNLTSLSSKFILQSLVEDKQTKMRETLRLMSLTPWAYAVSYFLFQTIFAFSSATIMSAFVFN